MNDTVITAIIGGICTIAAAFLAGWFVYRRSIKVDLAKTREDAKTELIDKWKEYSQQLQAELDAQDEKLAKQDTKIDELRATNREQESKLIASERRISELEQMLEMQARQLAEMERRLGNLEGSDG